MSGSIIPYELKTRPRAEAEPGPVFDVSMLVQPPLPKMVPAVVPQIRDSMDPTYAKLAALVGVDNYPIRMAGLESFLAKSNLGFYKQPEVDAYLQKQAPKGKIWCWKPLRTEDQKSLGVRTPAYANGDYNGEVYQRQIPFAVLVLVGAIEHHMPDNFDFVVSDFFTPAERPDPFLGVAARGMREQPWRVIFHWDEPDFKGGFASKGYIER